MRKAITFTALLLCIASSLAASQKRKGARRRSPSPSPARKTPPAPPPIVGAQVTIATKTGEQISGQVLEFTAYSVRVKQGELESTVPVESIASMRFGDAPVSPAALPRPAVSSPDFTRDAESVTASFQAMDSATQSGTEYSDYGRRLAELRRASERFVGKYYASEDQAETKMAVLFSAALIDYTLARTIWTLRLGQGPTATVTATDSPAVADALDLYPDLAQLGPRNRLPADKLVAALWKQASLKIGRCRRILEQAR